MIELKEAYEDALLALNEEDYELAEDLSIEALENIPSQNNLFDLNNQFILFGGILIVLIIGLFVFGRKKEPKVPKTKKMIRVKV